MAWIRLYFHFILMFWRRIRPGKRTFVPGVRRIAYDEVPEPPDSNGKEQK
jgi:hypothetical protein